MTLGTYQDLFSAGVVQVDRSVEFLRPDLSLAGCVGSFMSSVILDPVSALTSIRVGLLEQIYAQFGGGRLRIPFENGPQTVQTATSAPVTGTYKTVPISVSVHSQWGAVEMPPVTFALMPVRDNMASFGRATMEELGIDLYPMALESCARVLCRCKPVWKTTAFLLLGE